MNHPPISFSVVGMNGYSRIHIGVEWILKDITTVRNQPQRLLDWARIAAEESRRLNP